MARPYSLDLRVRIIAAVDAGAAPVDVAEQYQVSERTIWAWLALRVESGGLAPREGDVGRPPKLEEYRDRILQTLRETPDLTLPELHAQLQLPGCLTTLWNTLAGGGITLKKSAACERTVTTGCAVA